ncbi:hypothetical protein Tco_1311762 [Tanacetum coccineum]
MKPKRKDIQIPRSSGPTKHVADEAVYKELDDSLVRAATTASSLKVEQDSGGGPRCQKTMGDTITQTRFENVSKLSNDPLLVRGNTLQSGEDSLKLKELIELCTNLQTRVLDLEKTKTTQAEEIVSLKRRVKKLEQKKRSRTHGLKRLYKVGLTARVESSRDEENDADMFEVNTLVSEEVFVVEQSGNVVEEVVDVIDAASIILVSAATITDVEVTLAQALAELKSAKPKADKVVIQEPEHVNLMKRLEQMRLDEELSFKLQAKEEERLAREKAQQIKEANIAWDDVQAKVEADYQLAQRLQAQEQEELTDEEKARLFLYILEQRRKHFTTKRAEEKRNRPPTRAQQRNIMCEDLFDYKIELVEKSSKKEEIDLEENLKKAIAEVMEGSSKRAGEELEQESIKKQKVDKDKETVELQSLIKVISDEESPQEGKEKLYANIRADGKSQMYKVFSQMLKSFSRKDLEDLYKLVKAKYGSTRPVEDLDLILYGDLKTMFKPHVEDQVLKNQG